jgi:hypothetical protein
MGTRIAARVVAAAGGVLAIVGLFLDALPATSYWEFDGTVAWLGLVLAGAAVLLVPLGYVWQALDGWLFAIGAVLIGYWSWFPAVTAFDDWDQTGAGLWLCLGGAALIALGSAATLLAADPVVTTPAGLSLPSVMAGLGIALVFPGIFLHAEQDVSYWNGPIGHSLGVLMLIVAGLCLLAWGATVAGMPTGGLDSALTLVLLGLVAFDPVGSAFNNLGDLQAGAWLALAGGILAAGGTWAARGAVPPAEDTPLEALGVGGPSADRPRELG